MSDTTPAQSCMTVLYDGECPLCRREIAVYQGLAAREPVRWVDVSAPDTALPGERSTLLARFHVQREDGSLLSGAEAFLALWARLPGWRWLAFLGRLPGSPWLMERAYTGFLRVRPAMQRVARRLDRAHSMRTISPMNTTFETFRQQRLAEGFDEVLEREWAPLTVLDTHTHPFAANALVARGEMWLTVGDHTRHLQAGDTFELDAHVPHAERYGAEGAAYWVARRNA